MRTAARHIVLFLLCVAALSGCFARHPPTVRIVDGKPLVTRYVSPGAYHHYLKYRIALNRGHFQAAVMELQQALAFDAQSPYLHTLLAELLARYKLYEEAHEHLAKALEYRPGFPDALALQGKVYWKQKKKRKAEASFRRCIRQNPKHARCYLAQATLLQRVQQYQRARAVLRHLVNRVKNPGRGHTQLALLCLRMVDYTCAEKHLELSLRTSWAINTLIRLAHVHRALGHRDRAVRLLREAFDRSGGHLKVAALLLDELRQAGKNQAVTDLLQILRKEAEGKPGQMHKLAALHLTLRLPVSAAALLEPEVRRGGSPVAEILYADAISRQGRLDEARKLLQKHQAGPRGVEAALQLALTYVRRKDHARAAAVLQQGLSRKPNDPRLASALSRSLYMQGQLEPSMKVMRAALTAHADSEGMCFSTALALERAGKWREANALMASFLSRHPENGPAHNFIGYTTVLHGNDLPAAERHIRRALMLDPGQAYIIDSLGWLLYKQGKLARARRLLRMAIRLSPREAEVLAHLAEVNASLRNSARAMELLKRAISVSEDEHLTAKIQKRLAELSAPPAKPKDHTK